MSSSDPVTAQDTVTLLPVQPASGVSACPGQDVTINCTIVSVTNIPGVEQPTLTWVYRDIRLIYRDGVLQPTSDPLNNGVYTAVFSYSHFYVNSVATILNVPLSHHNSTSTRDMCENSFSHMSSRHLSSRSSLHIIADRQ